MTTTTTTMKFSENEYINYQKKEGKKFETPDLEHEWALTQFKTCTKCNTSKPLPDSCLTLPGEIFSIKTDTDSEDPNAKNVPKKLPVEKTKPRLSRKNSEFHTKPLKMLCVKFVKNWEPEIMDLSLITATKRTSSEAIVAIHATEAWAFLETTKKIDFFRNQP